MKKRRSSGSSVCLRTRRTKKNRERKREKNMKRKCQSFGKQQQVAERMKRKEERRTVQEVVKESAF